MVTKAQAGTDRLKAVCTTVVKELVDYPDSVVIAATVGGEATAVITVQAVRGDYGKVIGKKGKNVIALRTLLEAIAAKHRMRLMLEIDDGKPQPERQTR